MEHRRRQRNHNNPRLFFFIFSLFFVVTPAARKASFELNSPATRPRNSYGTRGTVQILNEFKRMYNVDRGPRILPDCQKNRDAEFGCIHSALFYGGLGWDDGRMFSSIASTKNLLLYSSFPSPPPFPGYPFLQLRSTEACRERGKVEWSPPAFPPS